MDIRLVRKQLQTEFANLNMADFDAASLAASDFFDYIHNTDIINEIIKKLPKNAIDVDQWGKDFYNQQEINLPRNKQERIAFFLAFLEKHKDNLLSISHYFRAGSSKFIDHIRKYIDTMVKPIYQYLDNELHIKELEVSPVSTTSITANHSIIISGNNYGPLSQTNIGTLQSLSELSDVLQRSSELTDEQKLEVVNNIDTIKNQVVSPKPNKQIIKLAWQTVSAMATTAGATDFVTKVAHLLAMFSS